jgi:hypothetical protein
MFFGSVFMTIYSAANVVKYLEAAITGAEKMLGGHS